ncbi:MAG: hypothetical protein K2O54_06030 [Prevotella sp.]|nr:hypothetical protein [Prevotella sp.]
MSFSINLYTNTSATNVVNKNLTSLKTLTGNLRGGSSVLDPVIEFQEEATLIAPSCNYLQIPAFGRYYYITNIISTYNGLCEVHCHVDVLMSYADQIKLQVAVVARQEAKYNLMLDDGFFMCYQNPKFQTKLFSVADPFEKQEFVLVVAGSQTGNPISTQEQQEEPGQHE